MRRWLVEGMPIYDPFAPTISGDGTVLLESSVRLSGLSPADGATLWSLNFPNGIHRLHRRPLVADDGSVIVATADGYVAKVR